MALHLVRQQEEQLLGVRERVVELRHEVTARRWCQRPLALQPFLQGKERPERSIEKRRVLLELVRRLRATPAATPYRGRRLLRLGVFFALLAVWGRFLYLHILGLDRLDEAGDA